jgi:hypothetical protein
MSPFPFHGILRFEHLFVPLLVGVFAGSPAPALSQTATAAEGDSAAAASDSLGPDSSSVAPLRVHLEGGYVISASRVTALPSGLLRIVGADGSIRHVSLARVKRIEDENGCGGFMATEMEWLRRAEGASDVSGDAWYERLDLGAMRNMGPRIALGGTVFLHGSAHQGSSVSRRAGDTGFPGKWVSTSRRE